MILERRDKVYLAHTDASGVLYFGAPSEWLMRSSSDLLERLGLVLPLADGFSTPVRALSVEYIRPLVAHDEFVQRTFIASAGRTSFVLRHEFRVEDELRLRADVTHVCVSLETWEVQPVPDEIRAAVVADAPDAAVEAGWRRQLAAAGIPVEPGDVRMLHFAEQSVGPLRDALLRFDLADVAPEARVDYGAAPDA